MLNVSMRKRLLLAVVLAFGAPVSAHSQSNTQGAVPSGYDKTTVTPHFVIAWNQDETAPLDMAAFQALAETLFVRMSQFLGKERTPAKKLVLILDGDARLPNWRYKTPHVDGSGRIVVYHYPGRGYIGELAHEMAHAFRASFRRAWDGFIEEGFAEFVATIVHPEVEGFPRYGYPLTVVAGHWLASEADIPLEKLRNQHGTLNLRCKFQSYPLRAAFFHYLNERFGKAAVFRLVYSYANGRDQIFQKTFGENFDQLAAKWREDLLTKFHSFPEAEKLAKTYRKETPIQYWPPCNE